MAIPYRVPPTNASADTSTKKGICTHTSDKQVPSIKLIIHVIKVNIFRLIPSKLSSKNSDFLKSH